MRCSYWLSSLVVALILTAAVTGQFAQWGYFSARVAGPRLDDGTEIDCDYPTEVQFRNTGGSDGAGLCVFASVTWAANYAGHFPLGDVQNGLFTWMRSKPGGGYPSKLAQMIRAYCQERGVTEPAWMQIEDNDLDKVARLVNGNHLVGITYCRSPTGRYNGQRIGHMVTCAAARVGPQRLWAVIDNNYIGTVEWMSEEDFRVAYTGYGGGWCVAFKRPGPPLPPSNKR